jgi:hypothetical protein
VQCKKYNESMPVSVSVAREMLGIKQSLGIPNAVIVTTGRFTASTRELATNHYYLRTSVKTSSCYNPGGMSTKPYNIFISWSGPRSKHVASALRQWLPDVLQSARPWMSDSDIDKGSRGIEEISKALETIEVGISCLTPENLTAPWLLFEGGALSKRIGNKARLCTYLLGGMKNGDVPQPLGMFQHTVAEKAETRKMLDCINEAINPTEPVNLDRIFEKMWPDLEDAIQKLPKPEKQVPAQRAEREMIAEVLDIVRGLHQNNSAQVWEQQIAQQWRDLAFGGEGANKLAILGKMLEGGGKSTIIAADYKNALIPEPKWIATNPNCPDCGSLTVVLDAGTKGRYCTSCGATNGLPVRKKKPGD